MILDEIVASTRRRLAVCQRQTPLKGLRLRAEAAPPPRDFESAITNGGLHLIAELKRASPSLGDIKADLDVASLAQAYARGGASALSVLTEPDYFKGSLDDLALARQVTGLPVLRKDFTLDAYQVYEARAYGADAVLLIAAILADDELRALEQLSRELGMAALVEVHSEAEVKRALAAGARLIGINNRDLADFTVSLATTLRLRPLLPQETIVVSESGISTPEDVQALRSAHVHAILVGEALVRSPDPEAKVRELVEAW
ncbi:MAG TPA: indole-3-glycerol phosphate synthase TrpC [Dehalococcoidia bacterium]|jgi:indole-3-glycerol phosphate synthase|nr:indole-3-glycerol phosphate synthase TrpC [Dehalococcoidia bacterium]